MSTASVGMKMKDVGRANAFIEKQLGVHRGTTMESMGSIHHAVNFVVCIPSFNPILTEMIHFSLLNFLQIC
jgi:hypothetical protein